MSNNKNNENDWQLLLTKLLIALAVWDLVDKAIEKINKILSWFW